MHLFVSCEELASTPLSHKPALFSHAKDTSIADTRLAGGVGQEDEVVQPPPFPPLRLLHFLALAKNK